MFDELCKWHFYKYGCVNTHTHEKPHPLRLDKLHRDFEIIEAGKEIKFEIEGPAEISSLWCTISPFAFHGRFFPAKLKEWLTIENLKTIVKDLLTGIKSNSLLQVRTYSHMDCLQTTKMRVRYDNAIEFETPLGAFFGLGFGDYVHYNSLLLGTTSGGYYSYFPMPFKKKCVITIRNEHEFNPITFYFVCVYRLLEEFEERMYFMVDYNRKHLEKESEAYKIFEKKGKGKYVGTFLHMKGLSREWLKFFYLEGNIKFFVDGEQCIEYTGTEDYFLSGWYFNKGVFNAPFHGLTVKDGRNNRISAYRFHIIDPIPFKKSIVVEAPHGEFNEVECLYESTAYYYLQK